MCSVYAGGLDSRVQLAHMQNEMLGQLPPTHRRAQFINEENAGYAYFRSPNEK